MIAQLQSWFIVRREWGCRKRIQNASIRKIRTADGSFSLLSHRGCIQRRDPLIKSSQTFGKSEMTKRTHLASVGSHSSKLVQKLQHRKFLKPNCGATYRQADLLLAILDAEHLRSHGAFSPTSTVGSTSWLQFPYWNHTSLSFPA